MMEVDLEYPAHSIPQHTLSQSLFLHLLSGV